MRICWKRGHGMTTFARSLGSVSRLRSRPRLRQWRNIHCNSLSSTGGFDVPVLEVEKKYLDKGFAEIEKSLAKFAERPVEKGGITPQQKDEILARVKGTTNKAELADCDIVIEAIIENVEEKKKMYASLDGIVKKDAIFASNTSSISVTELLTAVMPPERFIGRHFFNLLPLMKDRKSVV